MGKKGGFLRDETANKRDFRDKKSGGVREGACAPRHCKKSSCRGIVLLENNGVLPLKQGSKVALYGGGARHTIKGGTGSGSVNNRSNVSIDEGLRNAGFTVTTDTWLDAYDAAYGQSYKEWKDYIYEISEPGNFDSSTVHMPAIRCRCQRAAPLQKRRRQTPST